MSLSGSNTNQKSPTKPVTGVSPTSPSKNASTLNNSGQTKSDPIKSESTVKPSASPDNRSALDNSGQRKSDPIKSESTVKGNVSTTQTKKSTESIQSPLKSLKSSERSKAVSPTESISSDKLTTKPGSDPKITPLQGPTSPPPPPPPLTPSQPPSQPTPAQAAQVVSSVTVTRMIPTTTAFGPYPAIANCPHCESISLTETKVKGGSTLMISTITTCVVSCISCCPILTCVPPLIEEFYDIEHHCRNCGRGLGHYVRPCC